MRGRSKLTFTSLFRALLQLGHSIETIATCPLNEFLKPWNEAEFQSGFDCVSSQTLSGPQSPLMADGVDKVGEETGGALLPGRLVGARVGSSVAHMTDVLRHHAHATRLADMFGGGGRTW